MRKQSYLISVFNVSNNKNLRDHIQTD